MEPRPDSQAQQREPSSSGFEARIEEVPLGELDMGRFVGVLSDRGASALLEHADHSAAALAGRRVWNVSSTAHGGGVAEMLHSMLAYERGRGIDARWCVIDAGAPFFALTKRIHNRLHGSAGDGGPLDAAACRTYESTLAANAAKLRSMVEPGDVVILHDPQTAGLAPALQAAGAHIVWRSHVGTDSPDALAGSAWAFLFPYVQSAELLLFSRAEHVWDGLDWRRIRVVPPAIDPFSAKNQDLPAPVVEAILEASGILPTASSADPAFVRSDGSPGLVGRRAEMPGATEVDPELPIVCQVSRWDRLKDPVGVIRGFVDHVLPSHDAQLIVAGPENSAVADDPEGAAVLNDVLETWRSLDRRARSRVVLACLPMDDAEENAAIVNALQRRADIIVQKSLAEGFGLTVTEAMWKGTPLVASRVGGIQDQVENGVSGLLLDDPSDLPDYGQCVRSLLGDPEGAGHLGAAGRNRVRERFLLARMIGEGLELYAGLLAAERAGTLLSAPVRRWLRPLEVAAGYAR